MIMRGKGVEKGYMTLGPPGFNEAAHDHARKASRPRRKRAINQAASMRPRMIMRGKEVAVHR